MSEKLAELCVLQVEAQAASAARDGAASLYARCVKAPNGKATLTIKVSAVADGGKIRIGTKWTAAAADKESDDLPDVTVDANQPELINSKE